MTDILNLALPYFGLIFVGFACGKLKSLPEGGLAWMNFFLLYVSLPALFFRILSRTPFEQLNNLPFVLATTAGTASVFCLSGLAARWLGGLTLRQGALAALGGAYGNVGYMGPGLALAVLGVQANVPVALIFCFDNIFLFTILPLSMALTGGDRRPLLPTIGLVLRAILLHPLIIAAALGTLSAALHLQMPVAIDGMLLFLQNAAAPTALFALGVTVALRPFGRVPWEVPGVIVVKLVAHPLIALALMLAVGPFPPMWAETAVLMASLPTALNVFILARQYDAWIEAASMAVLLGTFVSVVTLTGVMWLIKTGMLPF